MKLTDKNTLGLFGITLLLLQASALAQSSGCPCPALAPPNNGGQLDLSAPWLITGDFTAANNPAYFSAQVISGPSAVPAGTYLGWCVDTGNDIGHGPTMYSAQFFASCDPNLNTELGPGYPPSVYVSPDVWHQVNYILNHKNGAYFWNIQLAIWNLIGGPIPPDQLSGPPGFPPADQNQVLALLAAAQANAAAWQPQCGDTVAIVVQVQSVTLLQLLILEVPCNCVCTGQIGDFVWQDLNGNGCQDAGEPGIQGVQVDLYSGCGAGATFVTSMTTDANGKYLFTGLCAGNYSVVFHTPAGYNHTLAHQTCSVGGLPSNQTDSDCDCTGTADCTVCVNLPASNSQDLTIDCGYVPICTGQIGDFVWQDLNGNGCQDAGEPGIQGVQVDLYSGCGAGATFVTSMTTDANGKYLFTGLCAGNYSVVFHTPAGYNHTLAHQTCSVGGLPSNQTDSDCDCTGTADCTVCVNLPASNSQDLTIDCGYVPICTGQIGDFVWQDLNGNGCQDAGEPGIPNVQVDLYSGCGAGATLLTSMLTDANGKYLFTGLCAGNYSVVFHTPAGYAHTLVHQACNVGGLPSNQTDSDCECTGTADCAVCVNLPAFNSQDLTIDCGYVISLGPPLAHGDTATIGFWHNRNGQALINSFNGGASSTALGNWLASNFNCLFGSLKGAPNSAVASQFLTYFSISGQKTYAQIMAAALASYATDSTLAGGNMAASYGFHVSSTGTGTGTKVYNVGSDGAAIGLSGSYTVGALLNKANASCMNGVIPQPAFNALNSIFSGINQTGDIP
jgi:5-hydroxyisourate hydrolase-like protein (transthyretin family)